MKDKNEKWEKEFKKLFPDLFIKRTGEPYKDNLGGISNTYEKEISWEVKSFISQLLKDQREELKKEVERMGCWKDDRWGGEIIVVDRSEVLNLLKE